MLYMAAVIPHMCGTIIIMYSKCQDQSVQVWVQGAGFDVSEPDWLGWGRMLQMPQSI